MASSSGTSSGSTLPLPNSGSEDDDLRALLDQRKAKRMLSNRESARRSRMRKQKHLDDLTAQINHLKKENEKILVTLNLTRQGYFAAEAENSVLRTQVTELNSRLQSLNEILLCMNGMDGGGGSEFGFESFDGGFDVLESYLRPPWSTAAAPPPPPPHMMPMVSPEMFQYC